MRIALLTSGRFWLVDLARELAVLGHHVKVYSLVPPTQTRHFGLPRECNRWLGLHCAPFYAASKIVDGHKLRSVAEHALMWALDNAAAREIEPCDVLIAMSGIAVRAVDTAKRRHGALVFLERGSRHILSQREILEGIPGMAGTPVSNFAVDRELVGYGLADFVTVPAQHVVDSFLERGFPERRLFRNPFGVNLEAFQPTDAPATTSRPTILMTGTWSLRKGCDLLVEAWRSLPGVRLLHVGPVLDAPLPTDPLFTHVEAVPQHELRAYYEQADVFALASREEGLALVQVQALACGLKVVCTSRTGGEDLRPWTEDPRAITVVPPDDAGALGRALHAALEDRARQGSPRDLLGAHRNELSWGAYAKRYERRLLEAMSRRSDAAGR